MRIANGQKAMRILLTKQEFEELSENGKKMRLYVGITPNSLHRFVSMSHHQFQGSISTGIIKSKGDAPYPDLILLSTTKFKMLKGMSHWSPEGVTMSKHSNHEGVIFDLTRPAMERAPRVASHRKTKDLVKDTAKVAAAAAALIDSQSEQSIPKTNSGGLPAVQSPKETNAILNVAADILNLDQAVRIINEAKRAYGDRLVLQFDESENKLKMFIEFGVER